MNAAFSLVNFVIRHQGLGWGGKYCVYDQDKQPLLYVHYKTHLRAPHVTYGIFADAERMLPALTIQEAEHASFPNFFEVFDGAGGEKVGGVGGDWKHWLQDAWNISDAVGNPIALVRESGSGRALLHELSDGFFKQKIDIVAGDQTVATLRQKRAVIGHHLVADFGMDAGNLLDRRLGLVAAVMVACHQGATDAS